MLTTTLPPSAKRTPKAKGSSVPTAEPNYEDLLSKLGKLWSQHYRRGLEVRLTTGQLLNEKLGDPFSRQGYGRRVLENCKEKTGVTVSELSRMRHFAASFKSLAELAERYPEATTWTKVKDLLPTLRQKAQATDTAENATPTNAAQTSVSFPVQRTIKVLDNISSRLANGHLDKDKAEWKKLDDTIRGMVAAASKCLGVSYALVESPVLDEGEHHEDAEQHDPEL